MTVKFPRAYDGGASIRDIAKITGRSYGYVHRMLAQSGVTLRGRGGDNRRKNTDDH